MFTAIMVILSLPFTDKSRVRGMPFFTYNTLIFLFFVANFLILLNLGAKHVESPFIELGQISAFIYFLYYIIIPFFNFNVNRSVDIII
jgi:ubiquinol-cytochrome c reductase cytochrome b subunit